MKAFPERKNEPTASAFQKSNPMRPCFSSLVGAGALSLSALSLFSRANALLPAEQCSFFYNFLSILQKYFEIYEIQLYFPKKNDENFPTFLKTFEDRFSENSKTGVEN